jgi:IclR family pca regulon transcriptional regulator
MSGLAVNPDFVLSLARGLKVIESFHGHSNGRSASEIAADTGLSRAAVRRLLITLESLGYAEHLGPKYRLRTRILRLGFAALSSNSLPMLAQPILENVTAAVHESCSLSILEDDEIVYLARSTAQRVMSVGLSIGSRLPAYCTSMGRVLLAALPDLELGAYLKRVQVKALTPKTVTSTPALLKLILRVRANGYALVNEELEPGLRSIAVPVKTRSGRTVAAMNSGVHAARIARSEMTRRLLPVLRENAQSLGLLLA